MISYRDNIRYGHGDGVKIGADQVKPAEQSFHGLNLLRDDDNQTTYPASSELLNKPGKDPTAVIAEYLQRPIEYRAATSFRQTFTTHGVTTYEVKDHEPLKLTEIIHPSEISVSSLLV
ncbi:hypothetical protein BDV10DRAFT_187912 [Aspergillus recurvatus]